ncbi:uncharacterized protein si:ch1073-15f19.2 isoform X2 [Melanotaenia boesemani]|uniref:uncharacterized protein si:ch1073-15f19.2 isoform X2 n=1 Tax=Melanotaenia boesemani TaxID=1250792 RepID=UPI001C03F4AE|nr:uncharacterized protein si:ch1073-15f19.2 isoform X2 [Melanotaenia boesemani]
MAGNALGIVFSILLLASFIEGLQDVELLHLETLEAVVGKNITLPCLQKKLDNLKLISIEWKKKGGSKLGVYSPLYGQSLFSNNVTIQIEDSEKSELMGSYLHIPEVNKRDSGIYICEITSFPFGSIANEMKLTVKDDFTIKCNVDGFVEIPHGENAKVHCAVGNTAQYRWTKDKELVSETKDLELRQVTDAHAGVYKLTVNTGDKSLHKDFIITVLPATTSLRTDPVTVSLKSLTKSHSSPTQSLTAGLSTHVNWATRPNPSSVTITAAERITPSTISTPISVTSSPATHPGTHHLLLNSTTSHNLTTAAFRPIQEITRDGMRSESTHYTLQPEDIFSISTEESSTVGSISENSEHPDTIQTKRRRSTVAVNKDRGDDQTRRSHLLLVLIVIPLLLLIAVIGFLYRRQIIKKRIDLPPSFKPPPPPVKYTTARQSEIWRQSYPISRCDSVPEPTDLRQTFV